MKIKWLGHSSFLITSEKGQRIITDPYSVIQGISYSPINETADIVTVSHGHGDHNNARAIKGNPSIINDMGVKKITGIEIKGVAGHHDEAKGSKRGSNLIFCFAVDGINVCHLGDLGHLLSETADSRSGPGGYSPDTGRWAILPSMPNRLPPWPNP